MADFDVTTRGLGGVKIIDLKGYLDAHTAPELEKTFNKLIDEKNFKVIVNFEELKYISSAGLGVFMAYIETMRENSGDIKFAKLKDDIYNIFDLLGFPVLYEFYKEEKDALEKFNQKI